MLAIVHPELGNLAPEITTVEPFNPRHWLTCPGNLAKLQRLARRKYCRDCAELLGTLPRKIRAAAIAEAIDSVLCRFLDADYGKAGITNDEPARAALYAVACVRRGRWRYGMDGASRRDSRKGSPYIGSMASRGDNPAAVAVAIEEARKHPRYATGLQEDLAENRARAALTGEVRERKTGGVIHCPGGTAYGESRKMVPCEGGGWMMETKKSHKPTEYGPGEVPETVDAGTEPGTFVPAIPPATGLPSIPGTELTRKPACPVRAERIAAGDYNGRARVVLRG